eukprot:gnl/TRDRNA2_/TRDRNA2_157934_c0_seq1.p1 gnl/TRDRNA2_/TRDRNA2_157934_c0~~gnl/TRDRNA2_/TRDRNA2_157934_c0_seq1.p1  ORF type:complete len:483 (-),score=157.47 gnl/TRDRNA2_/TRDRNA2_157934_c0_seq1:54-1337(-)
MDEAALVQKDLSLAQKSIQQPLDIDRTTAAKHISEALSLQYLGQSMDAKLKQVKQLLAEFKPIQDQVLAATTKYKGSGHDEKDFEEWYDEVSEGLGKIVASVGSESKAAEADVTKAKKDLDYQWDRFEEATTYADMVTKLAVSKERGGQAAMIAKTVTEQNDIVLNALEAYQDFSSGAGFVEKKFGKTFGKINAAVLAIRAQLEGFVQINEQKVKEVNDAKVHYQSRSPEQLNKGIYQLIAMDKSKGRTEVAKNMQFGFFAREGEYVKAISTFSQSKRTAADFKAMRSEVESVLNKAESMVKTLNEEDKKGEKASKDTVLAAFENLADEGEFAQKVVKFATHWGRQRLESDLLNVVLMEQDKLKTAFDAYEKNSGSDKDKEFGKVYQQLMVSLVTLKGTFQQWVDMSDMKESQMKDDNLQLNAWLKQ